jgi:hypothetical protein
MSRILDAKYLNGYISIDEYDDSIHYQKIYCPECSIAQIHIVRKQDTKPYFASNRKEEHQNDCQHYEEFVSNKNLNHLIESKNEEDQERLEFLIESNLNASIRLLLSNSLSKSSTQKVGYSDISKNQQKFNTSNSYKKESIPRVNIKNVEKRPENIDNHTIIYGRAELEIKNQELVDSQTKKEYTTKKLVFSLNDKIVFSILLSLPQIRHLERENGKYSVIFAVFGKLVKKKSFFNLRISTTKNLKMDDYKANASRYTC